MTADAAAAQERRRGPDGTGGGGTGLTCRTARSARGRRGPPRGRALTTAKAASSERTSRIQNRAGISVQVRHPVQDVWNHPPVAVEVERFTPFFTMALSETFVPVQSPVAKTPVPRLESMMLFFTASPRAASITTP